MLIADITETTAEFLANGEYERFRHSYMDLVADSWEFLEVYHKDCMGDPRISRDFKKESRREIVTAVNEGVSAIKTKSEAKLYKAIERVVLAGEKINETYMQQHARWHRSKTPGNFMCHVEGLPEDLKKRQILSEWKPSEPVSPHMRVYSKDLVHFMTEEEENRLKGQIQDAVENYTPKQQRSLVEQTCSAIWKIYADQAMEQHAEMLQKWGEESAQILMMCQNRVLQETADPLMHALYDSLVSQFTADNWIKSTTKMEENAVIVRDMLRGEYKTAWTIWRAGGIYEYHRKYGH